MRTRDNLGIQKKAKELEEQRQKEMPKNRQDGKSLSEVARKETKIVENKSKSAIREMDLSKKDESEARKPQKKSH